MTVPVGVPVTGEVTEAVKVTAVPIMDGLFDEVTTEEELAVWLIVCVRIGEVLAAKFASPP